MWKSKKFVIIAVLAAVVLAGSVVGVAFADTGTGTTSGNTLYAKVVAILNKQGVNIDQAKLESAFTQARQEIRDEALDKYLDKLVAEGKLKPEDAQQYKQWWDSKPNVPLPGARQPFGMHRFPGGRGGMMGGWGTPAPTPTK